jgi:DNA integrity scanning protein DisA with diadenylate cyclase activity
MDKNRFETQKEVVNLDPTVHNIQALFTVDDLKWLIAQAEKVKQLTDKIMKLDDDSRLLSIQLVELTIRFHKQADYIINLEAKLERAEKKNEGL